MSASTGRNWSPQQQSVFKWFEEGTGNLIVRARAGTGKTTTILEAIEHAPEEEILLAAFNKSIAEELKTRLKNPKAQAKTLHSVGVSFVYRNWPGVQLDQDRGKRLATKACGRGAPDDAVRLTARLAGIGKNVALNPSPVDLEDIAYRFDCDPDDWLIEEGWTAERIAQAAFSVMQMSRDKDGTIDFDDMVYLPVANSWVRPKFQLVVVDEAQDMSLPQLELARKLVKKGGRMVVVGDDRQAIYGFRGADSNSLDRLKGELVAHELGLTVTYRCPRLVVERAKRLVPDFSAGEGAPDGVLIDKTVQQMYEDARAGDFILSRKNAPLAKVCLRLIRVGKRAMVEGREVGAGLKSIVKQVGGKTVGAFLERLARWEEKSVSRLLRTGKETAEKKAEHVRDQAETMRNLCEDVKDIPALLVRIDSLFAETPNGKADYIVCSSIHKSKGRERERVFLLEATLYPGGRKSIEEDNINYVGTTRAKKELYLVQEEP